MDLAEEDGTGSLPGIQHLVGAFFGFMLLIYMIWHHKKSSRSVVQRQSHEVTECRKVRESDSARCRSPTCVTCRQELSTAWKQRLQTYIQTHVSDKRGLPNLQASLNSSVKQEDTKTDLQRPTVCFLPTIRTSPWYELENFSGTAQFRDITFLRDSFAIIKNDCADVYSAFVRGDKSGWTENKIPTGSWMVFPFFNQGENIAENCRRCPGSSRVLDALETLMTGVSFGHACFSILQPGSRITPHYGPCNFRVRCHLGLHIPKQSCLTVARETRAWKEGDVLLFDDSFLHEASNMSSDAERIMSSDAERNVSLDAEPNNEDQTRAILMVDLWHPDLNDYEKEALMHIFSHEAYKKLQEH